MFAVLGIDQPKAKGLALVIKVMSVIVIILC